MAGLKKSNAKDVEQIVDEIENEESATLGDVSVSEDGYVHDEPLLAGYLDPKTGIIHKTFSYREMNGKDEEAINKSDVRANGGKLVNILVERCVTEIGTLTKKEVGTAEWGKIIRNMLGGDLDYMAFKIRELSKGNEVSFQHVCPECKTKLDTIVNTDEFTAIPFKGEYEVDFVLPRGYKDKRGVVHKEGVMRIMNGFDREIILPILKKNSATATTMLITRLVKFNDNTVVVQDLVSEMTVRDREYLENIIKDNIFGVDLSIELSCPSCGTNISGEIGQSNFF